MTLLLNDAAGLRSRHDWHFSWSCHLFLIQIVWFVLAWNVLVVEKMRKRVCTSIVFITRIFIIVTGVLGVITEMVKDRIDSLIVVPRRFRVLEHVKKE